MTAPRPGEAEAEPSYASRTTSREWPPEVQAIMDAIAARLSWASLHWGVERVHPEAWPHIAAAALDAARSSVAAAVRAEDAGTVSAMCHWKFDPDDMRAPGDQHSAFHFGRWPGQTGVCPYFAMAEVLRGNPDPRGAAAGQLALTRQETAQ